MRKLIKCNFNHLRVDDKTHQYYFEALPSVSSILDRIDKYYDNWRKSDVVDYNSIDKIILKKAQERGNCFHKAMENYVNYGFDETELSYCVCENKVLTHTANILLMREWIQNNWNIVKSFKEFRTEQSYICFTEQHAYCPTLFTGTLDLTFIQEKGDKLIINIVDYKTSSRKEMKKWSKQLLLYWYLLKGNISEITNGKSYEVNLYIVWVNANKNKEVQILPVEKDWFKEVYNEEMLYEAIKQVHYEVVQEYKLSQKSI